MRQVIEGQSGDQMYAGWFNKCRGRVTCCTVQFHAGGLKV